MKTFINMGTLELTIWLCLLDGSTPHRSVGMETAAANQLFLPSPALALTGTDGLSNTASGRWPRARAERRAVWQSEAASRAHIVLPLRTPFPGLAAPARSPASVPWRSPVSFMHPQQHCKGDEPFWPPLFFPPLGINQLQPCYRSQPSFSLFSSAPDTPFSSAPGASFLSAGQNDKLKIFLSRKTQTCHLIFCLFGLVLFLEKQSFISAERFYLTYIKKPRPFLSKLFFFKKRKFSKT